MKPSPPLLRPHITAREPSPSTPSSCRFHGLNLDCQLFNSRFDDSLVIAVAQLDGVGMRARFEDDVVFLRQTFVHIRRQTVEIAKGRHRSYCAIGKQRLEFLFATERRPLAKQLPDLF